MFSWEGGKGVNWLFVVSFFLQFHELDGAKFFMRMYCYLDCCFSGSVPGKVVGALLSPSE